MKIHILGICGTFMGGLAILAKQAGHTVSGMDLNIFPPMGDQLLAQKITFIPGYDPKDFPDNIDLFIIGNALSRGNSAVEYILDNGLPFHSGPQWLHDHVLKNKWVIAVSGTHGKTSTSSMLAWILEYAGMQPGFLIGGIPLNFNISARTGNTPFFVIEADEYDTAFFDKRSKFLHYAPRTVVINNIEFDHADIFSDIDAIKQQFHHFVRIVPSNGKIIFNGQDSIIKKTLEMGCWSETEPFNLPSGWQAQWLNKNGSHFEVYFNLILQGTVNWSLFGQHNSANALAAIAAARHAGVPAHHAIDALAEFKSVKRRLETIYNHAGIRVYDDFAHHPTAIQTTLEGLRNTVGKERILAIIEPRSNTMQNGTHKDTIAEALAGADLVYFFQPATLQWEVEIALQSLGHAAKVFTTVEALLESVLQESRKGDHLVIMSNGSFEGLQQKLLERLQLGE